MLDRGYGEQSGSPVCFHPTTEALGLVMPSNSPAVNSLWLPATPENSGGDEARKRLDPYQLMQAFISGLLWPRPLDFTPPIMKELPTFSDSATGPDFGDKSTTDQYAGNPGVQVHGPGFSKVIITEDEIENWMDYIDVLVR